ncbi:MAG: N-acetyltransferase family protein [Nocardioidaceae bacterium]
MFRDATPDDLSALRDLERRANLAALGHVFPPERYPFPDDDVLARWALVLAEEGVHVLVRDADPDAGNGLVLLAAYDDSSLRHLAVRPDHWGRGLASAAISTVTAAMARRGSRTASLWVLEENHRARRLYEHLGWLPAPDRQEAPWPPHPVEMRYTRLLER